MLNYKFIHRYTNTILYINADSTEFAQKELEDIVLTPKEWYIDNDDYDVWVNDQEHLERNLPDSTEAAQAWLDEEVLNESQETEAMFEYLAQCDVSESILPSEDDAVLVD